MPGGWRGARKEQIHSDLWLTSNEARRPADQRMTLNLKASWNKVGPRSVWAKALP